MSSDQNSTLFPASEYCKKHYNNSEGFLDHISTSSIEVSDPAKILLLCETLKDRSTKKLEIKINKYVSIS